MTAEEAFAEATRSGLAAFQGYVTPWNEARKDYVFDLRKVDEALEVAARVVERVFTEQLRRAAQDRATEWLKERG